IATARDRKADVARRTILAGQKLVSVLKEPSLEKFLRRKVERELRIRAFEPAVNITMWHWRVALLVDVDIGVVEPRVDARGGHEHRSSGSGRTACRPDGRRRCRSDRRQRAEHDRHHHASPFHGHYLAAGSMLDGNSALVKGDPPPRGNFCRDPT